MEKQTKNILTKKIIADELRFILDANRRAGIRLLICVSPICIAFALLMLWVSVNAFNSLAPKIILGIIFISAPLLPVLLFIYMIYDGIRSTKLVDNGRYTIITKELSYKTEEYRSRGRGGDHFARLLHFPDFAPIEVSNTTYQLASNDDVFYFVMFNNERQPRLFYNSKMYEFKDER